jgi:hypothetical protein
MANWIAPSAVAVMGPRQEKILAQIFIDQTIVWMIQNYMIEAS